MTAREHPILFTGEMVRRILSGEKTQTRRLVPIDNRRITKKWLRETERFDLLDRRRLQKGIPRDAKNVRFLLPYLKCDAPPGSATVSCRVMPKYKRGDVLWVKETHRVIGWDDANVAWIEYRATPKVDPKPRDILTDDIDEWHQKLIQQLKRQGWVEKGGNVIPPVKGQKPHWKPSVFMERWMSRIELEVTAVRVQRLQDISEGDVRAEGIVAPWDGDPHSIALKMVPSSRWTIAYAALWESINGRGSWSANPYVWVYEFKRSA